MTKPKHIFLIIADSLRFDSVYNKGIGMPYMEKNASAFTEARSAGCWTLPATSSIFTGLMPHQHGATTQSRGLSKKVPTLAEMLSSDGYHTKQITANIVTTDIFGVQRGFNEVNKIWQSLDPKFQTLHRLLLLIGKPRLRNQILSKDFLMQKMSEDLDVAKTWLQNTYLDVLDLAEKRYFEQKKKKQRTFTFINMMETHFPYHIAPTFKTSASSWYGRIEELKGLYHTINQSFLKSKEEYIPQKISTLLKARQRTAWELIRDKLDDFIKKIHQDDDNLIVFCSDHGDNFGDQHWHYHFSNVNDGGNKVPLFWLDNKNTKPSTIDNPVSSRLIYQSILSACKIKNKGPSLFSEEATNIPVLQSYWYDRQGKTLKEYMYNQFCFIHEKERYRLKGDKWGTAPISKVGKEEPIFKKLENIDPIEEFIKDKERKKYLKKTLYEFNLFSDQIMAKDEK